jgi:hypothetical protein
MLPRPRRAAVLSGNPAAYGAAADVRSAGGGASLAAFLAGYPQAQVCLLPRLASEAIGLPASMPS